VEILAWLDRHPALLGVLAYTIGSALVNWLARVDTPEAWERLKSAHPRIAAGYAVMRAVGVDPIKLARAIVTLAQARWPGPPVSGGPKNPDKLP